MMTLYQSASVSRTFCLGTVRAMHTRRAVKKEKGVVTCMVPVGGLA